MNDPEMIYKIGLSILPGVGSITARKLLAYAGTPSEVFRIKKHVFKKIPGVGEFISERINLSSVLHTAEKEIDYIDRHGVRILYFQDEDYPRRLNHCPDGPVIVYMKGDVDLNTSKIISIVGTRNPTQYGLEACKKLVSGLTNGGHYFIVVSGLAYGIDICAHRSALNAGQKTIAVLGHGLRHMYPQVHHDTAMKIIENGALLTDFASREKPERNNFIKRNRIIAGLSDATIVIESGIKGGALTTAEMADSYNRDVFAVPGRIYDTTSKGCHKLIKLNLAALIEDHEDVEKLLNWDLQKKPSIIQKKLFDNLSEDEKSLIETIASDKEVSVDILCAKTALPVSRVSSMLLNLEFSGYVVCLPGNVYKLG